MKKQIVLSLLIILPFILSSQETNPPGFKVTSVGFSFGFAGAGVANTNEDFTGLAGAVNDPDLFIDPSSMERSRYNLGFGGNVSSKLYLGLTPYSKKKGTYRYDRELRFSFGTGSGVRRSFNYYQITENTIDTLTSATSGNQVIADSNIFNRYLYAESFTEFNLGVAFIFKTPVERRFHFTAGAGLEYAYAYRAYARVEYYNERDMIYYAPGNKPVWEEMDYGFGPYNWNNDDQGTSSINNTNLSGSIHFVRAHIPLGIHFRVSRKAESFFNKVYLFGEMNPGLEFQMVSNDKTYLNPYFGFAMFGFTYRW
ncbi:MAG: hypothetical protein P8100_01800 [bacterium]|jgi:hypothetical protein